MAVEVEQILIETQKAKRGAIGYAIGFVLGVLVTLATYSSPSSYFIITWGAIIFCPYYAIKNLMRYKKLKAMLHQ